MKNIITLTMIALMWFTNAAYAQNQPVTDKDKKAIEEFKTLLKETDKNKDGKISKDEYLAIWKEKNVGEAKFKALDADGNGYITQDEYVKATVDSNATSHMNMKKNKTEKKQ